MIERDPDTRAPGLVRLLYRRAVDSLSFSSALFKLRRELNAKIDAEAQSARDRGERPQGISRWFKNRRMTIAEAYLHVVKDLESGHARARLRALRDMVNVSFHAKTLDMPLNTARVQMALMKEAVKHRGDRRRQLELLQDFSSSTHGQPQVIRALLDELNIVELPETGAKLKNLGAGRDDHVHDTATAGRKNPTQLLIDAFIKGISELTVAYGSAAASASMAEAMDAGRIVGIRVSIGLELSVRIHGRRFHFMALLPQFKSGKELHRWLDDKGPALKPLFAGLERNQAKRVIAVKRLLKYFNRTALKDLNEGYPDEPLYAVPRLRLRDLLETAPESSVNRLHLGEFLHLKYRPVLFNRLQRLKVLRERARRDAKVKAISEWELGLVEERYARTRAEYRDLRPEGLQRKYFTNPEIGDYQTVFTDLGRVKALLRKAGCSLKLLHPLEHGFDPARDLLEAHRGVIDQVEVYNMQDAVKRDPESTLRLARLVNDLNARSEADGSPPYVPVCGSDSTGRNPTVPGMGFIRADRLTGRYGRRYARRHVAVPALISAMVEAGGKPVGQSSAAAPIISMGKVSPLEPARIEGEEPDEARPIPFGKAVRYLNPALVDLALAAVGFLVAQRFIGPFYAALWLLITGFRNSVADLVAGRGTRLSGWNWRGVNFDNVARSLFWTGFSVPIMGFVKARFDVLWPWAAEGALFDTAKFFCISFANGLYLATHNTLRGFDRKVVRANFFRSVIAWPLATAASPLGDLLGIPSIVQSKIWSDVVAGFIEGGSKYLKTVGLRRRDLEEILPLVVSDEPDERLGATLDLLYLFREEPRTESSLRQALDPAVERPAGDKEAKACSFDELAAGLAGDGLGDELLGFILERHGREAAAELTGLVADTLPELRAWLAARESRLSAVRRGSRPKPAEPGRPEEREAADAIG